MILVGTCRLASGPFAWTAYAATWRHGVEDFARAAGLIERGVDAMLAHPETRTRDLGGKLGTGAFTAGLLDALERELAMAE